MRILLRAFPAGFRRRYGDELLELVDARHTPLRDGVNLVLAGLRARLEGVVAWMSRQTGVGRHFLSLGVAAAAVGRRALMTAKTTARRGRSWAQWFCLLGGAFLLLRGTVGVALDRCSNREERAGTATYAAITLGGIVDGNDVAGVIPIETSDNTIHTLLTVVSLAMGLATLLGRGRAPARAAV